MLDIEKFAAHWQSLKLPGKQGMVLLGVSGGVDSMVMVQLFLNGGVAFAVGHCNFCLRGDAADGDEAFVRDWCVKNNIPFHHTSFDTKEIAAASKKGIQETARDLRYEWLEEIRKENGYRAVCTAHHANDVAETVLMNLARGTGIAGLHGISSISGTIVRPMLFATKENILNFSKIHALAYREDVSNSSDDYTRNALRHHVLSALETVMPGAGKRIAESAVRIAEAEMLYRIAVDRDLKKLFQQRGADFYIPVKLLRRKQPLFTITYEMLRPFGFSAAQTAEAIKLLDAASGRQVQSASHTALRNRDFIIITSKLPAAADLIILEAFPVTVKTSGGAFTIKEIAKPDVIPGDANICLIDIAKLEQPLILRRWKAGDYFYPVGMGGKKKKLSRYFIDQKIPLHEKERIWILESARRIVWVCGRRMDERFKITAATAAVLKVQFNAD